MGRLVVILFILAVVVAAATLAASARGPDAGGSAVPAPRNPGLRRLAFGLLLVVMFGVASGVMGPH